MQYAKRVLIIALPTLSLLAGGGVSPAKAQVYHGTPHHDIIYGTNYPDTIYAKAGHDLVYPDGGRDRVYLGAGKDRVFAARDKVRDVIWCGAPDRTLCGRRVLGRTHMIATTAASTS
jgi:hypothetical protein